MHCMQSMARAARHPMACMQLCGKRPRSAMSIGASEVGQSGYDKVGCHTPLRAPSDPCSVSQVLNAHEEQGAPGPITSFSNLFAPEEGQDADLHQALQYAQPKELAAFIAEQEKEGDQELEQCVESLLGSGTEVPCNDLDNPASERALPLNLSCGPHDVEQEPKRRRVSSINLPPTRTGSGKACCKTLDKRTRLIESIISRADASDDEKCQDMAVTMLKMVRQTNGRCLTMVCIPSSRLVPVNSQAEDSDFHDCSLDSADTIVLTVHNMVNKWQHAVQLLTILSRAEKDNKMAIEAIERSELWGNVKAKILAQADKDHKFMSREKQVALFKMSRLSEAAWVFLSKQLEEHVKLLSPSTLRTVMTNFHQRCLTSSAKSDVKPHETMPYAL
jgi:hypothetical protein